MSAVFYEEIPRDMPVVVCDNDNSTLSRQLIRMIEASPSLGIVGQVHDIEEGAALIRRGKIYAIFYIPKDMEHDLLRNDAPAITVFFNNQWVLVSGVISRAARDVVGALSAKLDVRYRMATGETPAVALKKFEPIRVDTHLLFNPNLNYRHFLLPALLPTIFQVFIMMVTCRAIGGELKHGTAPEWLEAAGGKIWPALFGKMFPHTVCFTIIMSFMFALMMRYLGVPQHGSWWVVTLASILFIISYESMGMLFVTITANLRLANSIAGFYTGPAFAFGGITFPSMGMPLFARVWGASLPLTHYLYLLLQQAMRGAPPQASANSMLYLFLFAVVPPLLTASRLKRISKDPAYWGHV